MLRSDTQSDQAGGIEKKKANLTKQERQRIIELIGERTIRASSPTKSDGATRE